MYSRQTYNKLFVELLPEKIKVADQLPSDPNFSVMELSVEEFQKKMNMYWCETILYDEPLITEENKQRAFPPISKMKLMELLQQSLETRKHLTICYMGPELGYGLYGKVPKGGIIGFYTGVQKNYRAKKEDEDTSYHIEAYDINQNSFGYIDAKKYGNDTRYIQHAWGKLPNDNGSEESREINIQDIQFYNPNRKSDLTTENVEVAACTYGSQELILLTASSDIDGWVMMSYGNYWSCQNKMPALIDHKGQIIPPEEYYYSRIHVSIYINSQISLNSYLNEERVAYLKRNNYVTNIEKQHAGIKEVILTANDFKKGLSEKDPHSIFLFFKKPTEIKYQSTVIGQLQSLTESFGLGLDWKYNNKAKTAWLENADVEIKQQLKDFFAGIGLDVSVSINKNTKNTLVLLKNIDVETLTSVRALKQEMRN